MMLSVAVSLMSGNSMSGAKSGAKSARDFVQHLLTSLVVCLSAGGRLREMHIMALLI
jgi:hypothetical protein